MQSSRKKFWLIFGIVCASVVVICTAFALATRLKTVTVEFRTRLAENETVLEQGVIDKVLKSGDFNYGKCVLFMNFNENISNIEKSNPYVKVEQVIRHFPNVARVYISERIPKFRIRDEENEDKWYILDADFKVVDVVTGDVKAQNYGESSYYEKTIEVSPDSLTLTSYVGDFVDDKLDQGFLNSIVSGVVSRAEELSIVKSVKISKNNGYKFTLTMKNSGINNDEGCEIVIQGESNLEKKVFAGISCFCDSTENQHEIVDLSNKVITIEEINGVLKGIMNDK